MSQITESLRVRRLRNQQCKRALFQQAIPQATRTYGPVANEELYDVVTERVRQHGLTIVDEEFDTALKGQIMTCKLHINSEETPGINRVFAFMNSYNKMRKVSFASGGVVMACSNGMFIGDEGTFTRRHHSNIWDDIHSAVDTQVNQMHTNFTKLMDFKMNAEETTISPQRVAQLAGRMYFDGILSPRMLSDLKKEVYDSELWKFEQTPEGKLMHDTVWKLYNNCTEAAKRAPAHESIKTHAQITQFLSAEALN
jgi:hypothetical protein